MNTYHITALQDAINALRQHPRIDHAVASLRQRKQLVVSALRDAVLAQIKTFSNSANPELMSRLDSHGAEQFDEVLRLLSGGTPDDFAFVQNHARWSATERLALEMNLHVYRCGHRVYLQHIRDAMREVKGDDENSDGLDSAINDFSFEYVDAISTVLTTNYIEQIQAMSALAYEREAELMNLLLDGYDESDARIAAILRRAGYLSQRHTFCVVNAQSVNANEMSNPERARRLARAVEQCIDAETAKSLIDIRGDRVVCVYAGVRRVSGWTAEAGSLASRIAANLQDLGTAVVLGVSGDVSSTAQVPNAAIQAGIALQNAGVENRVVEFRSLPLRQLMIHLSSNQLPSLMPQWSAVLYQANDKASGVLQQTLWAYAQANMNALKAAARLDVHPNTIYARFQKVRELTGLDPRSFDQLNDLLTVFQVRLRG